MSSQKQLHARPRSMSAKAPSSKSRPISGLTTATMKLPSKNIKTELITSIYNGKEKSPKRNSSKNLLYQGISTQQLARYKRNSYVDINKQKQQLYEQNIQLKKQINKLSQQLSIIKSKAQSKSKKVLLHQKQLDIQFEKQVHWGGTKSYMISGIKHQYEKLKKQHSDLFKSYEELKIALMQTKIPQYKIYAEAIQVENRRLIQHIKKLQKFREESFQNLQIDKQASLALSAQNQQNCRILTQKLTKIDIQLRNANQSLKDKQKKLQFQQKLLIQKGNTQFHLNRKLKKSQQINHQLQHKITLLLQQIKQSHKQIQSIQTNSQIKRKQQIRILQQKYQTQKNQLTHKILALEQQNKLLQLTVNKLRMSSSIVHNNSNTGLNTNRSNALNNRKNMSTPVKELQQQQNKRNNKMSNFDSVQSKNIVEQPEKQRVVQRADKKHSQNSKKMRKVEIQQVKQIGQILKYRMINKKIDSNQIKNFFNYKQEQASQVSTTVLQKQKQQKNIQWNTKYISNKQTYKILSQSPFDLDQQSGQLLSRYLVQDCYEQYVYYDPNNQNTRDIVKSIMKSVIGEYHLPKQNTINQGDQFLHKYATNLQSALKTYNPSGRISKKRLLDTINGLGVQISEQAGQYLLAMACKNSSKLDQIYYKDLFIK